MARTYTPFSGELARYGFGPEHNYFGEMPSGATSSPPASTPTPNPYTPENNPLVQAYRQGAGSDTRGDRDSGVSGQDSPDINGQGSGMRATTDNIFDLFGSATMALPSFGVQAVTNEIMGRPERNISGVGISDVFGSLYDAFTGGTGNLGSKGNPGPGNPSVPGQGDGENPYSGGLTPQSQAIVHDLDIYGGFSNYGGGDPAAGVGGDMGYSDRDQGKAEIGGYQGSGMFAHGGNVSGASGGQADKVPAMLSHGEYVIDAPTVALLGGGNNEAGAKMLDHLRSVIRKISTGSAEQPKPISGEQLFSALASRTS